MTSPIHVVEAAANERRRGAALDFLRRWPEHDEVLLVGASRDAVDDLAHAATVERGATFGHHRFSLSQLLGTLAASEMAQLKWAPASPLAVEAVAIRVAFEARRAGELTHLARISTFPGFARALAASLTELRLAGVESGPLADREGTLGEVGKLLARFEAALETARLADRARLLELAGHGMTQPHLQTLVHAPLLLLDVPIRAQRERAFLAQLVGIAPRPVLVTVPAGDESTRRAWQTLSDVERLPESPDDSLGKLHRFLFSDDTPDECDLDPAVRFFSAPGEARECIEIARQILDAADEGVPFDEIAVFLRAPELYTPLLETAFRRARIPMVFTRGTRRPDPAGRAFLALLACKSERLSARRFAEYLSFGQVPELDEGAPPVVESAWVPPEDESLVPTSAVGEVQLEIPFDAPPPVPDTDEAPRLAGTLRAPWRWEEYLVEAAVIGGKARWRRRLSGLDRELRVKLAEQRAEEADSPRVARYERELVNLRHFERFAFPVIETLDALPDRATWGEWLDRLSALAPSVLTAPERVLAVLADLRPMAEVGPVGIDEVRDVLTQRLADLEARQPPHRAGHVVVATPDQARGRSFQVVFVPGLAERVFPQRPREDPLLLDEVRRTLSVDLATQEDRGHDERLRLRLAAGAARERAVLSYPRVEVAQARPRVPSFYALDVARATRGFLPDYEVLVRGASDEGDARLAWPAPADPARAIDPVEHDLAHLAPWMVADASDAHGRARYLLELNEHLTRSLRTRWKRWRESWSPYDGLVGDSERVKELLASQRPNARPYSVTALQKYAACPYRFLLSAIHRLEPREDPVALVRLDPLTRGSMFHEVQAATLRRLDDEDRLPVDDFEAAEAILSETLDRIADRYHEELAPAIERVWQDEVAAMRADLRVWLRRMAEDSHRWVPAYFELRFGLPIEADHDPRSIEAPISLPGGWQLRGAVDLVERSADGAKLRVTDHKTGRNRTTPGWVVGGGETLQPVLYGLAMQAALRTPVESGRLYFCTARGGFGELEIPLDERASLYGGMVMSAIDAAVAEGVLPPAPKTGACRWCDFVAVCGPHEETRVARKNQEKLQGLTQLRELP